MVSVQGVCLNYFISESDFSVFLLAIKKVRLGGDLMWSAGLVDLVPSSQKLLTINDIILLKT